MKRFTLDTDVLTLCQENDPAAIRHLYQLKADSTDG
jgi:hypothetical protein